MIDNETLSLLVSAMRRSAVTEKTAAPGGPGSLGKRIGTSVATALATAGALGTAGFALGKIHDNFIAGRQKRKAYDRMMLLNPSLSKYNPDELKPRFDTLYGFSPAVASDPITAGTMMNKFMTYKDEGVQVSDIKSLSDVQKAVDDRKVMKKLHPIVQLATGVMK